MKIEITNQQGIKRINLKKLEAACKKVCKLLPKSKDPSRISILLCDNALIKKLNKRYLKKASITDVIAFPLSDEFDPDYLGEVIVSVEQAQKLSQRLKISFQEELLRYLIHGILHLLGYKDSTKSFAEKMMKKQEEILVRLSNDPKR